MGRGGERGSGTEDQRCEILISLWEGFLGGGLSLQIPGGTIRPGSVTKWVEIVKLGMGRQDQKLIQIFICHFNLHKINYLCQTFIYYSKNYVFVYIFFSFSPTILKNHFI